MFNFTTTEEKIRFVAVIGVEKIEEMREVVNKLIWRGKMAKLFK